MTLAQHDRAVAQFADLLRRMRDKDDRLALLLERADLVHALALERLIADGENFVNEEHLGVDVHGNRERETHVHAGRIELHLGVDELADPRELDDVVEGGIRLLARQAEDGGVQVDVFAAGQVFVEARAELEECSETSAAENGAGRGGEDAADHLQQGALAGSVWPDEAHSRARVDVQRDALERPEVVLVLLRTTEVDDALLERLLLVDDEALRDIPDLDHGGVSRGGVGRGGVAHRSPVFLGRLPGST